MKKDCRIYYDCELPCDTDECTYYRKSPTDLERFVELYSSFGIECKVNKSINRYYILLVQEFDYDLYDKEETRSDKFCGYSNFYSNIQFDLDGKFIKQGFWE